MALRKLAKILLYGSAGTVGLVVLLMLGVKLALDRVPHYQTEIEYWVHEQIGYHIAFAHVSPAFRWYGPELYFDRLELRSKDGRRVLARAAGGRIGADVWQLIRSGKLLAARIELDSPDIYIARLGPEEFALASEIKLGGSGVNEPMIGLDELPAGTLAIRGGTITVQDWNQALPRLELRDVNLNLRRRNGSASLAVAATLPGVLGGEISVNASARGPGPLDTLAWTALVRARNLSFGGWRELMPEFLARLGSGSGGFELAATGRGAGLTRADLDFDAAQVTARLSDGPGVVFDRIGGTLTIAHAGDRWTLLGRRVRAQRAGRREPDSEFDLSWRGNDDGLVELKGSASYLRAETLLPLAGLLPQKDLREQLQDIEPTGEWIDTHLNLMRNTARDPWQFIVQARFRDVGFAAVGRAPGLRGLNGMIAGTDNGGRVQIDTQRAVFAWPIQLPQPVDLQALHTTLYWQHSGEQLLVATPAIDFKNHDAAVRGRVAWQRPADGGSAVLTMAATVEDGNAADAHLYFPRALIAPLPLAWLNRAFVAGRLSHADVVFQGPVRHFPFRDGSGLFLARARLDGMTLDYREGWPPAENMRLAAEFRNEGLTVQLLSANIGGMNIDRGDARFVDFKTGELQLHVTGNGDAGAALDYLAATPLDAMAEHAFSITKANGPMEAEVDLFLPFKQFDQRRILVHSRLSGVTLNRRGSTLAATELTGEADLEGPQVVRADVHGKVLGGSFQMQARAPRSAPATRTLLVFNGTFSGESIRSALSLPVGLPINGSTDWHGVLRMAPEPARERSLRINGSLTALELKLPEPLSKPVGHPLPSMVEVLWPASGGTQIRVAVGSLARGQLRVDSGADGPQLARAAITFGAGTEPAAYSDTQTINVGGVLERLDLGGWLKLYTPDKNAKPLASLLRSAKFEVGEVEYLGLSFRDVAVDLTASDAGWRIGVGGPNIDGSISVPGAAEAEPWQLEFQRLRFTDGPSAAPPGRAAPGAPDPAAAAGGPDAVTGNPRTVPAIHFHASDVIWGERELGEVKATLAKLDDGISLSELSVAGASFAVDAHGEWRGKDGGSGRIVGTLSSTDVAATLKQLGYDAVIEAKTGKMDFDLKWAGAPTANALSLATGQVQVALDKGQIIGLKPGAGRVVGLASVAALPRRLALDFSDLTDKGFAFDTVRGSFDLREGSAFTDDVLVKGPAAEIGLIGRVGLKNKDYDQTAVVTGNVGSTLPLAAFAGGPVVGAAVLVFTQVFKQPLRGLARGYYRITGNWDNPTVERIKSADAAAATAEAPR
jgi:uncharacterized protein (TIGR02099 family)